MLPDMHGQLYSLFARLLEYPTSSLGLQVEQAASMLHDSYPQSHRQIAIFEEYVNIHSLVALEELYTLTFDLQGVCCPYVGHQLFGESFKRSRFMACLNHEYHARQFSSGTELPDHVSVILHFLALGTADEFSQTLACEGLVPALTKMTGELAAHEENPYRYVLQAALDVLSHAFETTSQSVVGSEIGGVGHA
jgi:nitrate reductase delta subunit